MFSSPKYTPLYVRVVAPRKTVDVCFNRVLTAVCDKDEAMLCEEKECASSFIHRTFNLFQVSMTVTSSDSARVVVDELHRGGVA